MNVIFGEGYIQIDQERFVDWKEVWKKLKKKLSEGQKRNRKNNFKDKVLQSEIPFKYDEDDYEWLKSIPIQERQQQYLHYKSKWLKQKLGRNSEDSSWMTDADCVAISEKPSSTFCQDVKTGMIRDGQTS